MTVKSLTAFHGFSLLYVLTKFESDRITLLEQGIQPRFKEVQLETIPQAMFRCLIYKHGLQHKIGPKSGVRLFPRKDCDLKKNRQT